MVERLAVHPHAILPHLPGKGKQGSGVGASPDHYDGGRNESLDRWWDKGPGMMGWRKAESWYSIGGWRGNTPLVAWVRVPFGFRSGNSDASLRGYAMLVL